ncbi:MAG: glycosyltransferase family 4 protein [Rhodospirillales bacterium]|nr:glycosyltransferase family 4 protein [Rhodospirillales bacterium]
MTKSIDPRIHVLIDMHYALQPFSGISQETRLTFGELASVPGLQLGGVVNTQADLWAARSSRGLEGGYAAGAQAALVDEIERAQLRKKAEKTARQLVVSRYRKSWLSRLRRSLRYRLRGDPLQPIDTVMFGEFVWNRLFAPTLPARYREEALKEAYFGVHTGRRSATRAAGSRSWSAKIDTSEWDVLIAQTPFPYRVDLATKLIIRYYDAIPVLHPDTVSEGAEEARRHLRLLRENVRNGASFCCISEPVRDDLLRLAPEAEGRVCVIPCMVSPLFYPQQPTDGLLQRIVDSRTCPASAMSKDKASRSAIPDIVEHAGHTGLSPHYIMAVSTLEPRKNYQMLISAWSELRKNGQDVPDLVLVANPGWRFNEAAAAIGQWRGRGLFHLWKVPMDELRVLYSAATAVICPSIVEGFDLSGVEAMRCDSPVIASDIPVHRSVYGNAALYFDPHDTASLVKILADVGNWRKSDGQAATLRLRGLQQSSHYRPEVVATKWLGLLEACIQGRTDKQGRR